MRYERKKRIRRCIGISLALMLWISSQAVYAAPLEEDETSSGVDIVLVLDHSNSVRAREQARYMLDRLARLGAALCGGGDSTMGIVYFSGGFLPATSVCHLPGLEQGMERDEMSEQVLEEYRVMDAYPELIDDSQAGSMKDLNCLSEREALIRDQIGVLSENVKSTSSNLATGLNRAVEMLRDGKNANKAILLFSDGHNDTPDDNREIEAVYDEQTRRVVQEAKKEGIVVYGIYLEEFNQDQADEEQLRNIVNYFGEEEHVEQRLVRVEKEQDWEQQFLAVVNEITGARYRVLQPQVSARYRLSAGQASEERQNVSVVFCGAGVRILGVERDGVPMDGSYYNYGKGEDCISGAYIEKIDQECSYEIITNGLERVGYEVYSPFVDAPKEEESTEREDSVAQIRIRDQVYMLVCENYQDPEGELKRIGRLDMEELCENLDKGCEGITVRASSLAGETLPGWTVDEKAELLLIPENMNWLGGIFPCDMKKVILHLERDETELDQREIFFVLFDKIPGLRYLKWLGALGMLVLYRILRERIKEWNEEQIPQLKVEAEAFQRDCEGIKERLSELKRKEENLKGEDIEAYNQKLEYQARRNDLEKKEKESNDFNGRIGSFLAEIDVIPEKRWVRKSMKIWRARRKIRSRRRELV